RRVQARAIGGKALPSKGLTAAETRLAESLMPDDDATAVRWNIAVMELGALVCTAKSPRCDICPVLDQCAWVAAGRPEAEYVPRGQAWKGTDRQARGAMMAVLREATEPVPPEALLSPERTAWKGAPHAMEQLRAIGAPGDQLERCLEGLVRDALASRDPEGR